MFIKSAQQIRTISETVPLRATMVEGYAGSTRMAATKAKVKHKTLAHNANK